MRRTPVVYGSDRSLLDLPVKRSGSWHETLRNAVGESTTLICKGRVPLAGSEYRVSLWRRSDGSILTVARRLRPWGKGPLVTDQAMLKVLQDLLLIYEVPGAVCDALHSHGIDEIDISERLFDQLVDETTRAIIKGMHTLDAAAKTVVERMMGGGAWYARQAQ